MVSISWLLSLFLISEATAGNCYFANSNEAKQFKCFNMFGDPVEHEVTETVPEWGFCEKLCGEFMYPNPLDAVCSGETMSWTPPLNSINCLDATAIVAIGGLQNSKEVRIIGSRKKCGPDSGLDFPHEITRHTLDFDTASKFAYVCGGDSFYAKECQKRNLIDPNSKWEKLPKMNHTRQGHSSVLAENKLIILGGTDQSGRPFNDALELDLTTEKWSRHSILGPFPSAGLVDGCAVYLNGKIYILGGIPGDMQRILEIELSSNAGNFQVSGTAKLQVPRINHACAAKGDAIFISGGNDYIKAWDVHQSVEKFSPGFDVSVFMPDMHMPRSSHVMGIVDGRLTVVGGYNNGSAPMLHAERFNEILDRWEIMTGNELAEEASLMAGVGDIPIKFFPTCL